MPSPGEGGPEIGEGDTGTEKPAGDLLPQLVEALTGDGGDGKGTAWRGVEIGLGVDMELTRGGWLMTDGCRLMADGCRLTAVITNDHQVRRRHVPPAHLLPQQVDPVAARPQPRRIDQPHRPAAEIHARFDGIPGGARQLGHQRPTGS